MLETTLVDCDDELDLQWHFHAQGWTDGLPVIVPTRRRVEDFVERSGFADERESAVGAVPPSMLVATVEAVAVNALMAGCRPEHLGVVLAATEAMLQERFRLEVIQVTTNPSAPFIIINGPKVADLGIACEDDALGPGPAPNGAIGRAVRLIMRNVGGGVRGIDHSSLGQPAKYTFCLGEAEHRLPPGWEPYHVSAGFQPSQSVVTVTGVEAMINIVPAFHRDVPLSRPFLNQFSRVMRAVGTNIFYSQGSPVVIISPGHAAQFVAEGYDRRRLQEELFEAAKVPLDYFPYGNLPIGQWTVEDGKILICEKPEEIIILVAGGAEGLHSAYLQPFIASLSCHAEVWEPGTRRH